MLGMGFRGVGGVLGMGFRGVGGVLGMGCRGVGVCWGWGVEEGGCVGDGVSAFNAAFEEPLQVMRFRVDPFRALLPPFPLWGMRPPFPRGRPHMSDRDGQWAPGSAPRPPPMALCPPSSSSHVRRRSQANRRLLGGRCGLRRSPTRPCAAPSTRTRPFRTPLPEAFDGGLRAGGQRGAEEAQKGCGVWSG